MRGGFVINEKIVKSEIFQKKLREDGEFEELYLDYLLNPTHIKKERLNEIYKQFEKQIIALQYLRKMIFFEAKRFDKKVRRASNHFSLDVEYDENLTFIDVIKDDNAETSFNNVFERELKEIFSDEELAREILSMTEKQKEVLHGLYVVALTEAVLAQQLGVTQQAISKTHKRIISRLKKVVDEKW